MDGQVKHIKKSKKLFFFLTYLFFIFLLHFCYRKRQEPMNNNNAFQVILISVDKHNDSFPNATDSRNQKKKKEQQQKKESQPKLSIITQLQFMKNAGFKSLYSSKSDLSFFFFFQNSIE